MVMHWSFTTSVSFMGEVGGRPTPTLLKHVIWSFFFSSITHYFIAVCTNAFEALWYTKDMVMFFNIH